MSKAPRFGDSDDPNADLRDTIAKDAGNERDLRDEEVRQRAENVMCEHLASFAGFIYEVGPRPAPDYSIDRIDNDTGYVCQACHRGVPQLRWATREQQARNRSSSTGFSYPESAESIMRHRIEAAQHPGVFYKPAREGKGRGKFEAYQGGKYPGAVLIPPRKPRGRARARLHDG